MRDPYAMILQQAAWAHLAEGLAEKAKDYFQNSITFETIRLSQAGIEWPNGMTALTLLDGLSRACHRSGDLNAGIEALESALLLSGPLNGNDSDITLAMVSRLKAASERQETMQRHHKAVVVASTATDPSLSSMKAVHEQEEPQEEASRFRLDNDLLEWELHENENPNTLLFGAAYDGDESMVRLLLGLPKIDPDRGVRLGRTALHMAAWRGHKNIVKLLLKTNMVDLNLRDDFLLDEGADIESNDKIGCSPLSIASRTSHSDTVRLLLDRGADIESKDNAGCSPLLIAAWNNRCDMVRLLLDNGADIESKNMDNCSPLLIALRTGHSDVVRLLLDRGADIESKDKIGCSPLSIAAWNNRCDMVRLLLDYGADIESKDYTGCSPLLIAAKTRHFDILQLLVDKGADIESKDNFALNRWDRWMVIARLADADPKLSVLGIECGPAGVSNPVVNYPAFFLSDETLALYEERKIYLDPYDDFITAMNNVGYPELEDVGSVGANNGVEPTMHSIFPDGKR
ncbi:hypothetical protein DL764_006422 [Monosporascus ibericus]|uniref:Uncharacterized protein n=1 Tax=Monosporascus ibericus TaxID=155417 RepID=A0A4Q4T4T6_9PEZI|nr:hypothetical protein DL764_006422 [Monosporascus ibericus]